MTDPLLDRLAHLDTCALSDAMDRHGIAGVALGLRALTLTARIVGRATTVQLAPDDGRTSKRHLCTAAVDASGPGSIVVIAHNGRMDVAGWGGILSTAACQRGVEGVVIDGVCRDIDESRELGLPVYGRGGVPVTARGRVIETDWNVPVTIAGITVSPGDYVVCDGSGVAIVPSAQADTVIATAATIAERERLMAEAVQNGIPVSEVMGGNYETMLKTRAE